MEHKIVEKEEFVVVGMPVKVSLKEEGYKKNITDLWKKFIPKAWEIKTRKSGLFFGICNALEGIEGDECSFEYMACVEVDNINNLPNEMKSQVVPKAKYFVVTHKGKLENLGKTYCELEKEMKALNFEEDKTKIWLEIYDERFKENSDDSEFDIYSPLK
ncbi:MAG: GyrI-like domain-containing protein [Candidatus Woesearchaeota archaeon]